VSDLQEVFDIVENWDIRIPKICYPINIGIRSRKKRHVKKWIKKHYKYDRIEGIGHLKQSFNRRTPYIVIRGGIE